MLAREPSDGDDLFQFVSESLTAKPRRGETNFCSASRLGEFDAQRGTVLKLVVPDSVSSIASASDRRPSLGLNHATAWRSLWDLLFPGAPSRSTKGY